MDVVVLFFRLHQQEKDFILSMEISLISWIEDIYGNKNVVNSCKVKKPEDISVDNFVDNIELILNRFISMKNEM
jgi:hypothetical protein